jgi:hypothetical protein
MCTVRFRRLPESCRSKLFKQINSVPTLFEVVTGRAKLPQGMKPAGAAAGGSKPAGAKRKQDGAMVSCCCSVWIDASAVLTSARVLFAAAAAAASARACHLLLTNISTYSRSATFSLPLVVLLCILMATLMLQLLYYQAHDAC